jgi:hypothetical protein
VRACLLVAAVAVLFAPARARAVTYTSFDFETPSYGAIGRLLSDFCFFKSSGTWHVFYTEFPSATVSVCRIGHASSTDLIHWTERPVVLVAGSPSWMSTGVWAPHVIAAPGGGWRMLFTGRNDAGAQVIASASSTNLDSWTLTSPDPVWTSPASWARWSATETSSCRDPFVWFDAGSSQYRMVYTAVTMAGESAIGYAGSADLLAWSDLGPLVVDPRVPFTAELESPFVSFDNGRVELLYSQAGTAMLVAPTIAGPWNVTAATGLDGFARAPELAKDGEARILARLRGTPCGPPTWVLIADTVAVTPTGYALPGPPELPASWLVAGNAFDDDPVFGDAPLLRGESSCSLGGFRWLSSAEATRMPTCPFPPQFEAVGQVSSPPFLLRGDALSFRLGGASSPDSAYAALVDDCTGLELVRQTGPNQNGMTSYAWPNAGRRGWPVRFRLVDALERPGGAIGVDDVRDTAAVDLALPSLPSVTVTRPLPGENLTGGSSFTIRWNGSSSAGLDSFVVYVSYDNFATPPTRIVKRTGSQNTYSWLVPVGTKFDVRVRVVAYAKNAVHGCSSSGAFNISVTTDAGGPAAAGLHLAAFGSPGPAPVLVWSNPAGGRARLELYDAAGRLVRELADADGAVERRTAWDGRDGAGRTAPPGVYFALLSTPEGQRAIPVVRLTR